MRRTYFLTKQHGQSRQSGMPFYANIVQLVSTFAVLFVVYIILALLDLDEVDLIGGLSFLVFQPIMGFILTIVTMVICFIIGLPIRFRSRFGKWWKANPYIPVLGALIALLLISFAFTPMFSVPRKVLLNEVIVVKKVPNIFMVIAGWFLLGFSLMHFYPNSFLNLFRKQKALSKY